MSGIYGIYQYDGAPVTSQTMDRMREAMAFYGPHGGGYKVEGSLGLGHLLLEVNPEDAFEAAGEECARTASQCCPPRQSGCTLGCIRSAGI